jgi:hypothetical protein
VLGALLSVPPAALGRRSVVGRASHYCATEPRSASRHRTPRAATCGFSLPWRCVRRRLWARVKAPPLRCGRGTGTEGRAVSNRRTRGRNERILRRVRTWRCRVFASVSHRVHGGWAWPQFNSPAQNWETSALLPRAHTSLARGERRSGRGARSWERDGCKAHGSLA